jgi:hypothetical protein
MKLVPALIFYVSCLNLKKKRNCLNIQQRIILTIKRHLTTTSGIGKLKISPTRLGSLASIKIKGDDNRLRSLK